MKHLVLRTVLPALLAIALFTGVVFFHILPAFNRVIMDQKRLMIRELTESAWNVLARCEASERAGDLTREQAQAAAISQVRSLHYGQESKDYFFIIDMLPRMIVHPYRPDLEGDDLREFTDPQGKRLFVEMVHAVEQGGAGYVNYQWQWKDDSRRVVPKLSYVKNFAPWGWIIGTGVYIDDVAAERTALTERLQAESLAILAVVSALLFVLLRTSFQAEQGRLRMAAALHASEDKHRSLVEAAGEAILMGIDGEGLFANPSLLRLLGYESAEFEALDVGAVIRPTAAEKATGRNLWQDVRDGVVAPDPFEAELLHRDGTVVRVMLSLSRLVVQGKPGFMAVATRVTRPRQVELGAAASASDLVAANRCQGALAGLMLSHGTPAVEVSRLLSRNAETVVRKGLDLAVAELGTPPGPFEFMLMGSLGRAEATLLSDQDHAIIHPDVPDAPAYFLRLGERVSEILDAAGYPYCRGGIMASQPACCQSLDAWRATFSRWIHTLEPDDLLHAKVFFDFRGLDGETGVIGDLRSHLQAEIARQPRFCHLLARSILQYEPPLSPFGAFVLESSDPARATFDIKGVMAQIVDYARLRALQHAVPDVGTLARLEALVALGAIRPQTAEATVHAFRFLLDLRLRSQAGQVLVLQDPDNLVEPMGLAADTQKELKHVLGHIKALQAGLDHEFKGA
jgi:PAS domain S-box-containing protein